MFCDIETVDYDIIKRDRLKNPELYYSKNTLYYTYKKMAEVKGHPFKLNYDEFFNITQQKCFYCGTPHDFLKLKEEICM